VCAEIEIDGEGHRRRRWRIQGCSGSQPSDEDQARDGEDQAPVAAAGGDEACSSPGIRRQGALAFPAGTHPCRERLISYNFCQFVVVGV
jgi:hypothetical protein